MSAILRPHQVRTLAEIDASIAAGILRIIVQSPTGGGKTIIGAHRLRRLQNAGKRGLFIVQCSA
jgi:superfamily II DNA or RNA helicase